MPREVSGSKPGRVLYLAGLVFLQAPYRSGDVSAIAPDASKGDTLSLARLVGQKSTVKLVETSIAVAWGL